MDSFSEIWSAACDYMKEALNVSDVAFNLWISPLVPESFDGQTAKFTCPTSYKIQIITTRYDGVIKEALTAVMGFDDIEVIYLFKPQETDDEKEQSEEKNHLSSRDSTSTFENFIVGSTNKFACNRLKCRRASGRGIQSPFYLRQERTRQNPSFKGN